MTLAWTKSAGDATVTSWQYRYKSSGDYGSWKTVPSSTGSTASHTVTGLTNATAHTFQLRGVNGTGAGAHSPERSATPALAAPAKPTGLQAHAGDRSVTLQWDDPSNDSISRWEYKRDAGNWTAISNSGASTTMHTVTELTNGTSYAFRVRAVNTAGNGAESDSASATPKAVPGQPTELTATGGNRQVSLSWKAPSGSVTGWEYRRRFTNWDSWTAISPGSGANSTLTHTVTLLDNNVQYSFQVRARNASGAGTPSGVASAVPVSGAPHATNFLYAWGGDGTVGLRWNRMAGPWTTHWEYRYKTTGQYGSWATVPGSRYDTVSHTFTLPNGKRYTLQVRAVNDQGASGPSPAAAADTLPLAPATLSATAGDEQVTLNWTKNGGDTAVSGWQYRRKPKSGSESGYTDWKSVPGSSASTTSHTVTGLSNGTAYTFEVRGASSAGTGPASSAVSATPAIQPPAKPTGLVATVGDTEVALSWDNPNNGRITKWRYSKDDGATWTDVPNSGASTTAYTVTGLTNNTAYTFRVRAFTTAEGPQSDSVEATPKPVAAMPATSPPSWTPASRLGRSS